MRFLALLLFLILNPFPTFAGKQEQKAVVHDKYSFRQEAFYDTAEKIMQDVHRGTMNKNGKATVDPILLKLIECPGHDTVGIGSCLISARQSYDKILNQVYQQALAENDEPTRKALRLSEQRWLSFRKTERDAQDKYERTNGGSEMGIVIGDQDLMALRERISELMFYLGADQG